MCSITGFGQTGELADHVSNDAVGQAMGGMAYLSGDPEGYPVEAGNGIADSVTATTAAMAIVAALFHRQQTGEGQYIDVAMLDTVMSVDCNVHPIVAATRGAFEPVRHPTGQVLAAPWGVFRGPGGRYFAMLSDWGRLCRLMGRPELITDARFATNQDRLRNREAVQEIVEAFLQSFEDDEAAFAALREAKIAAGPVLAPAETQDVLVRAGRDMVRDVRYPGMDVPTVATAPHFSATPIRVGRAPFIGEHNRAILRDLGGYDDDAIDRLHAEGVFYEDVTVHHLVKEA
jgi:crotonobetainyl-CoA:carnitine CoA-transferase CaiB-like acyl-CoA transferase